MKHISLEDFKNRVLTSQERVHFTFVDPYGHLNANRYLEFILNHRIAAAEEQLQCVTMDIAKEMKIGFVVSDVTLKYLSPAFLGEELEIASWVTEVLAQGFKISAVISSAKTKKVKLSACLEFKSVGAADGRLTEMPTALPTRSEERLIESRPLASEYVSTIRGLAEGSV